MANFLFRFVCLFTMACGLGMVGLSGFSLASNPNDAGAWLYGLFGLAIAASNVYDFWRGLGTTKSIPRERVEELIEDDWEAVRGRLARVNQVVGFNDADEQVVIDLDTPLLVRFRDGGLDEDSVLWEGEWLGAAWDLDEIVDKDHPQLPVGGLWGGWVHGTLRSTDGSVDEAEVMLVREEEVSAWKVGG